MAGLIAEVLFMLILLCNGQNIAEYEAYWLMGFPIINHQGTHSPFIFAYAIISIVILLCFQKVNKQVAIRKNL